MSSDIPYSISTSKIQLRFRRKRERFFVGLSGEGEREIEKDRARKREICREGKKEGRQRKTEGKKELARLKRRNILRAKGLEYLNNKEAVNL